MKIIMIHRLSIATLLVYSLLWMPRLSAQMWNGTDTLYGNEWINYEKTYYKIQVAEDGLYRLSYASLFNAGIPLGAIPGNQFQLYHNGNLTPLYVTSNGLFGANDFIEFFGEQNRSQIDQYLFQNPETDMLNPEYSLVTDSSAYFLTWEANANTPTVTSIDNDLSNVPAKEPWFWRTLTQNYAEELTKYSNAAGVKKSHFQNGEGFSAKSIRVSDFRLQPVHYLNTGDSAKLEMRFAVNERPHELQILINDDLRLDEVFYGYQLRNPQFSLLLQEQDSRVDIHIEGKHSQNDRHYLSLINMTYPSSFRFDGENNASFTIKANGQPKYLEIEQFNAGTDAPIVYNKNTHQRLVATVENSILKIALPPSNQDYDLMVLSTNAIPNLTNIKPVNFTNYDQQEGEFIIISNPALYNGPGGRNLVQEYADYRSTPTGGSYRTTIIDVNQLYDQFGYGLNRHYIAIRNFGHYIKKQWDNPQYVFLIGKGMEAHQIRTPDKVAQFQDFLFHVPTFGHPGSDNLLLADNVTAAPIIPIGRIAAKTPNDIDIYLRKVKAFDANRNLPQTIKDKYWMKKILHLGGGDPSIQNTIRSNLQHIEGIIENSTFGGDVTAFYKSSNDAIQQNLADELFDIINNGLSIITFFGHSGANTFDFSLDKPENYENREKYPIFISLGCYSGQIHNTFIGVSEKFVFSEDRGSIAFLASTGLGYVSSLRIASEYFYDIVGEHRNLERLGDALKSLTHRLDSIPFLGIEELAAQFTLHGDPSIHMNSQLGPDYIIDSKSVKFNPGIIDISLDSFDLEFDIYNLGVNQDKPVGIQISQKLPNQKLITLVDTTITISLSRTKAQYRIPTLGVPSIGSNRIFISLDPSQSIQESPTPLGETNNDLTLENGELGIPLFVVENNIRPTYPYNYGIVNHPDVTLYANTTDILAKEQTYLFEIDTSESFNSPINIRNIIKRKGGLIKYSPSITYTPNTVYYWRVSKDSISPKSSYNWKSHSFLYLPDETDGWNISHYDQFLSGGNYNSYILPSSREFEFESDGFFITLNLKTLEDGLSPSYVFNLTGASSSVTPWVFMDEGIAVVVGDSLNGGAWKNGPNGDYGSVNRSGSSRVFGFPTKNLESRKALIHFLTEVIPENNFVFLFTVLNTNNSQLYQTDWLQDSIDIGENIYSTLEQEGAGLVRNLLTRGPVHYGIIYQKGKKLLAEGIANSIQDELSVQAFIPVPGTNGSVETIPVGNVREWKGLSWEMEQEEENDQVFLSLYQINNGVKTLIADSINEKKIDLSNFDINSQSSLVAKISMADPLKRTPPQLKHIRFLYDEKPELSVNNFNSLLEANDSLSFGNNLKLSYDIESLNEVPFDSVLVAYTIKSSNNDEIRTQMIEPPLNGLAQNTLEFEYSSLDLNAGNTLLNIFVNPEEKQPELTLINNFINFPFHIFNDQKNPLLDVTYDGLHIQDGEIISSKPEIRIRISDENKYLIMNDTSLFQFSLTHPNGIEEKIQFAQEEVLFIGGSPENNRAEIVYSPSLLEDGLYSLQIQGTDVSGNASGTYRYTKSFSVINKNSISNLLNYPNPFSTSTQFVYTLTGTPPAFFKIQILTLTGAVVREISSAEIGPLRIGTHRTDYRWDGTDEYGDQLANGIYLYRVIAKDAEGKSFEKLDASFAATSSTNQYFKKGFGKMVILR